MGTECEVTHEHRYTYVCLCMCVCVEAQLKVAVNINRPTEAAFARRLMQREGGHGWTGPAASEGSKKPVKRRKWGRQAGVHEQGLRLVGKMPQLCADLRAESRCALNAN